MARYLSVLIFGTSLALAAQEASKLTSKDLLFQKGVKSLSEKKFSEAESLFRRLAEAEPENLRGIMGLAEALAAQHKDDEAIRIIQATSDKYPDRPDLHIVAGNLALHSGREDLAIAEFQRGLDLAQSDPRAASAIYGRLAAAYRTKGDDAFAVEALRKAQKLQPENLSITAAIGAVLATTQPEAAAAEFRKIIEVQPDNGMALNNLAFLLAESDPTLALAYAHRARQAVPNNAGVEDTLGWVYLKMKQTDQALEIFRAVARDNPGRAAFHYHLALALEQKGDRESARKEAETALKSTPAKEEELKIKALLETLRQ
jgi:Flp pilus assembly protein TadD